HHHRHLPGHRHHREAASLPRGRRRRRVRGRGYRHDQQRVRPAPRARLAAMATRTVLGHWCVYALLHRVRSGEEAPMANSILPGLHKGNVGGVFFAVGGDSRSHASGSDLPLRGTLTSIDVAMTALEQAPGVKLLLTRHDVTELRADEVGFLLVIE